MASSFPSRFDLKCSGCATICSQLLLCIAWGVFAIDYDVYEVETVDQVTDLHDVLSSASHRGEIEIACVCLWCAFPLMLIAIHGVRKLAFAMMAGTSGELLVYIAEKAWFVPLWQIYPR